ncbi:MAG: nitrate reductase, partial [Actinomycetes bacterium]
ENRVNFADPVNMVPVGAGIILAIGPVDHVITEEFAIGGIALGTIVLLGGYHLLRALARRAPESAESTPVGEVAAEKGAAG